MTSISRATLDSLGVLLGKLCFINASNGLTTGSEAENNSGQLQQTGWLKDNFALFDYTESLTSPNRQRVAKDLGGKDLPKAPVTSKR